MVGLPFESFDMNHQCNTMRRESTQRVFSVGIAAVAAQHGWQTTPLAPPVAEAQAVKVPFALHGGLHS
jgi:hypothetical protein